MADYNTLEHFVGNTPLVPKGQASSSVCKGASMLGGHVSRAAISMM